MYPIRGALHTVFSSLLFPRLEDRNPHPDLDNFTALADRTADLPVPLPSTFPAQTTPSSRPRYAESSVYPYLETNIDAIPMQFSQEPIPESRSALSISRHGEDTPFRHHSVIQDYISSLVNRKGYEKFVSYNTTVENAEKVGKEWKVILRQSDGKLGKDRWWVEWFDAVIVASGHYNVPYVPKIDGLDDFEKRNPGSVKHSKMYRGRGAYQGKVRITLPFCRKSLV